MRLFVLSCLYILAAFGFAFIVGYAKISLPLRTWLNQGRWDPAQQEISGGRIYEPQHQPVVRWWIVDLLQCPACLGFWIGGAFALADPAFFGVSAALGLSHLPVIALISIFGLATCASNFILGALTGLIEVH